MSLLWGVFFVTFLRNHLQSFHASVRLYFICSRQPFACTNVLILGDRFADHQASNKIFNSLAEQFCSPTFLSARSTEESARQPSWEANFILYLGKTTQTAARMK